MGEMIKVTVNGETREVKKGTTFLEISEEFQNQYKNKIAIAIFNGKIQELFRHPEEDGVLEFQDVTGIIGFRAYQRTALYLFIRAVIGVVGNEKIDKLKLEFSMGTGFYFTAEGDFEKNEELVNKITEKMLSYVNSKTPINKSTMPVSEAVKLFKKQNMDDKVKLCKYRKSSVINVYELDGYYDYFYGYMLPSADYISKFEVLTYRKGLVLNLPSKESINELKEFVPLNKVQATMMESTEWGKTMGIDTVGDLNNVLSQGVVTQMILVQEALQERKIGEIARMISFKDTVKFVMIAGPSSSGKTSFSYRLSVQLKAMGLNPHPIAVDDYFVNRENTPRDENGDYNFECLEAIDIELFNSDMNRLLKGEKVELPTFNFKTGMREYGKGRFEQLKDGDILVIEGIHALNDKMSYALPKESKFKIYISALTTLNIDEHNRIPTTDARLLRRMVRDFRTRGNSAERTIAMWPSVRRGEEENIFPYQETADTMFNSASIYELAVLKPQAEALLYSVSPESKEYFEAKRLLKFLEYFLSMDSSGLPNNSIVREFVGGSVFNV